MVIGCKDPDDEREPGDLGRFGSGMKTASFSQAKKLTVITKAKGKKLCGAIWDIDRIIKDNKWNLEVLSTKEVLEEQYIEKLNLKISDLEEEGVKVIEINPDSNLQCSRVFSFQRGISSGYQT